MMGDFNNRLQEIARKLSDLAQELSVLMQLIETDVPSSLNKMRFITEKVLHSLCKINDVSWGKAEPTLERMIGPLVSKEIIPKGAAIHIRTVQTNTSPGSHYQESPLSQAHVLIAYSALIEFLEWYSTQHQPQFAPPLTSFAPPVAPPAQPFPSQPSPVTPVSVGTKKECPHCHKSVPGGGQFCPLCGKPLALACLNCAQALPDGVRFCPSCGTPVPKKEETPLAPERTEYRFATVLCAHLSSHSDTEDLEDVIEIVQNAFERFGRLISSYEGQAGRSVGSSMMATFGVPITREEDPERALCCVRDMLSDLAVYNQEIGFDLALSIGLNCGKVYAGNVGGDQMQDFTVMGDTVTLADRLESEAGPDQVYVSQRFYQLTKYMATYESLDPISVKGKKEPQPIFLLQQIIQDPGSRRDALQGRDLPLQGRENEMELITGCLERLQSGIGGIISVSGESGMGKTRLGHEIMTIASQKGMTVIYSQAESFGRGWMLSLFRGIFMSEHFQMFWTTYGGDYVENRLLTIINGQGADLEEIDPQNSDEVKYRIIGLMLRFFRQMAAEKPLIIILDDLHFTEQSTLELLHEIIDASVGEGALLYCLLFRPDVDPTWLHNPLTIHMNLESLPGPVLKNFITDYFKRDVSPDLEEYLFDRCEGNPLFLLEFLNLFQETNLLQLEDNRFTLSKELNDSLIPDTLQGLLAASIDRLQERSREALQIAAVIGRKFPFRLLKETVTDKSALTQNLAEILKKKLLDEAQRFPELEYIFRTAISWEVAYGALSKKQIRKVHDVIGQAIEKVYANQLSAHYETLALHYSKAQQTQKAQFYTQQAFMRNKALGDLGTAITYLQDLVEFASQDGEKNHLRLELLDLYILVGAFDKARPLISQLDNMQTLATLSQADQARFLLARGTLANQDGNFAEGSNFFAQGLDLARLSGQNHLAAWILYRTAFLHFRQGNLEQAQATLTQSKNQAEANFDKSLTARCLEGLANLAAEKGEYDQADKLYSQALNLATEQNERALSINLHLNISILQHDMAKFEEAEQGFRKALDMAREIGNVRIYPYAECNLGETMFLQHKMTEAAQHFETAHQWAEKLGDTFINEVSELYLLYFSTALDKIDTLAKLLENPKTNAYLK
ncbi:adenylate/guanylate cyclase domain-containing protein, partial [candidate division CSSED10-310 bacterium]